MRNAYCVQLMGCPVPDVGRVFLRLLPKGDKWTVTRKFRLPNGRGGVPNLLTSNNVERAMIPIVGGLPPVSSRLLTLRHGEIGEKSVYWYQRT